MTTCDLLLKDAVVFFGEELVRTNLAVDNGVITMVSKHAMSASRKMGLGGKVVIPGLVDIHSHMREPGYTYKEDFESGSMAAAAGGVTMFVDMPNTEPPTDCINEFIAKRKLASAKSIVDFNHFVFPKIQEIPKVAKAGAAGFKIFMLKGEYPYDPRVCVEDLGRIYEAFLEVARTGLPCAIHPSNLSLIEAFYRDRRVRYPKESTYVSYAKAFTEELVCGVSVSNLLSLAKKTGVRLHLLHTHSEMAIALIRTARKEGVKVTSEIDPVFLLTTERDLKRLGPLVIPGGVFARQRLDAIWGALRGGTIDVVATDHAPHTPAEITHGAKESPLLAPFGTPQLEHYLSVLLTHVNSGFLTMKQLIRAVSANPARVINVYPRKGTIQVGSDADLVVVDMKREKILSNEGLLTKVGWSPYAGRRVKGVPTMTILRGKVVMEEGEIIAKKGTGRFVAPHSANDGSLNSKESM